MAVVLLSFNVAYLSSVFETHPTQAQRDATRKTIRTMPPSVNMGFSRHFIIPVTETEVAILEGFTLLLLYL